MYLTDVEKGGETVFPHVPKAPEQTLENGWSNCSLKVGGSQEEYRLMILVLDGKQLVALTMCMCV